MIRIKVKYIVMLCFMACLTFDCNAQQKVEGSEMNNSEQYNIKIIIGDTTLTATLIDNPATRDFISLLPLDLQLDDYAGTEKVSYLPKKLSTEHAPSGFDPSVGDVTYYAPWGNLAIFYKDFGYAKGLINLGKIDNGIEVLNTPKSLKVRIELIK
jgi:hypothetical protein